MEVVIVVAVPALIAVALGLAQDRACPDASAEKSAKTMAMTTEL
jgi:hypothetical protein